MFVVALLVAYNTRHLTPNLQPDDIVPSSTLQGYYLGQLLMGALGVLFVSGEYSTGMIRSTLAAVPRRLPVLWAKLVVVVGVTLVSMTVMSLVAFLAAQRLLSPLPARLLAEPAARPAGGARDRHLPHAGRGHRQRAGVDRAEHSRCPGRLLRHRSWSCRS